MIFIYKKYIYKSSHRICIIFLSHNYYIYSTKKHVSNALTFFTFNFFLSDPESGAEQVRSCFEAHKAMEYLASPIFSHDSSPLSI